MVIQLEYRLWLHRKTADHSVTLEMAFPNLNIPSMYMEGGGGRASVLEWEGAYAAGWEGWSEREGGEGEDSGWAQ